MKGSRAYKLTVTGIVQGVGFRPYAARLAAEFKLAGFVRNTGGIVEIFLLTDLSGAENFGEALRKNPPPAAEIKSVEISETEDFFVDGFTVEKSTEAKTAGAKYFPPDLGMCGECEAEILSGDERRLGYWFNSCVNCGPRYTILERFPYDRANTTMKNFAFCKKCAEEYRDSSNRRFHAETVCCHECDEPRLIFYSPGEGENSERDENDGQERKILNANANCVRKFGAEAFSLAEAALASGKIIAVKGIGGYHFMARADSADSIAAIRELKGRDTKPFANLFYGIEDIEKICAVSEKERELLLSPARPIVLLKPIEQSAERIGAFLPYTPLQKLLLKNTRRVIATSMNRGGAPIIIDDNDALKFCEEMKTDFPLWSGIFYNDRPIIRRAEDSVVQVTNARKISVIRRARGYVPLVFEKDFGKIPALALGGDLKTAFAIYDGAGRTIVSPYCGDAGEPESFDVYKKTVEDLLNLFGVTPRIILADAHPRYFTQIYARELAEKFNAELKFVSHHHAHIASVITEHNLTGKILGAAFDGTGYGDDGAVWGGEFLICDGAYCRRFGHLENVNLLGSDSAARDALKTAECFLQHYGIPAKIHPQSDLIRAALLNEVNIYKTSSMGRLFDAAAAMLGICRENTYEGECAVALQYAAEEALTRGIPPAEMNFGITHENGGLIFGHKKIIEKLAINSEGTRSPALGFHFAVADLVRAAAIAAGKSDGITTVSLSGGVFQNSLLAELTENSLRSSGFEVFTNEKYPANDGGICLGQLETAELKSIF